MLLVAKTELWLVSSEGSCHFLLYSRTLFFERRSILSLCDIAVPSAKPHTWVHMPQILLKAVNAGRNEGK